METPSSAWTVMEGRTSGGRPFSRILHLGSPSCDRARGNPGHRKMRAYVTKNDSPGADESAFADLDAWEDHRSRPQGSSVSEGYIPADVGPWQYRHVVTEAAVMADRSVEVNVQMPTRTDVGRYSGACSYHQAIAEVNVSADRRCRVHRPRSHAPQGGKLLVKCGPNSAVANPDEIHRT
jgi:hypothetical protein